LLQPALRVPCSPVMSFALLYSLVRFLLDALLTRRQSKLRLRAEVLPLRHQIRVLERQVRLPRWRPADRLLLAALSRVLPRPAWSFLLVSPETLLRWHPVVSGLLMLAILLTPIEDSPVSSTS